MMRDGRQVPRSLDYALSMVLSILFWIILGSAFAAFAQHLSIPYLTVNAPFLAMALGLLVSNMILLKQPFSHLISDKPLNLRRFVLPFAVYVVSCILFLLFDLLFNGDRYQLLQIPLRQRVLMLPLVLILTPIQTSAEEFVFRILPVRAMNPNTLKTTTVRCFLTSLVSALLFAAPHIANREVAGATSRTIVLLYYAFFGFSATWLSLRTGGFELSLAVHAANNLFVALIMTYPSSSLPSIGLVEVQREAGTVFDLIQISVTMVMVFLFIPKESST